PATRSPTVKIRRPSLPTLFPYTTLFRSIQNLDLSPIITHHRSTISIRILPLEDFSVFCPLYRAPPTLLGGQGPKGPWGRGRFGGDRKGTRLNSSHVSVSFSVFCLNHKL